MQSASPNDQPKTYSARTVFRAIAGTCELFGRRFDEFSHYVTIVPDIREVRRRLDLLSARNATYEIISDLDLELRSVLRVVAALLGEQVQPDTVQPTNRPTLLSECVRRFEGTTSRTLISECVAAIKTCRAMQEFAVCLHERLVECGKAFEEFKAMPDGPEKAGTRERLREMKRALTIIRARIAHCWKRAVEYANR
ncbi:MAG: hypothetical protein ABSE73_08995 [Planctomycetota bacterium]